MKNMQNKCYFLFFSPGPSKLPSCFRNKCRIGVVLCKCPIFKKSFWKNMVGNCILYQKNLIFLGFVFQGQLQYPQVSSFASLLSSICQSPVESKEFFTKCLFQLRLSISIQSHISVSFPFFLFIQKFHSSLRNFYTVKCLNH